eukprot:TRINITY_DN17366_c0_g1_i1.p1 TRINITY_DN17366_c0_g1~~TRINITY_DN17366_c0_g1_i1.p1  ORF type:complete len:329 (+),score=57.16 TRINITY_DN17366_c0_g1_i1:47-1033(+)
MFDYLFSLFPSNYSSSFSEDAFSQSTFPGPPPPPPPSFENDICSEPPQLPMPVVNAPPGTFYQPPVPLEAYAVPSGPLPTINAPAPQSSMPPCIASGAYTTALLGQSSLPAATRVPVIRRNFVTAAQAQHSAIYHSGIYATEYQKAANLRETRLKKNREAAAASRKKKKEMISVMQAENLQLQKDKKELTVAVTSLASQNKKLEDEVERLRQLLERSVNTPSSPDSIDHHPLSSPPSLLSDEQVSVCDLSPPLSDSSTTTPAKPYQNCVCHVPVSEKDFSSEIRQPPHALHAATLDTLSQHLCYDEFSFENHTNAEILLPSTEDNFFF